MDLDHTFRMLMVVGFFLLFPIGVYYRLKSQVPVNVSSAARRVCSS